MLITPIAHATEQEQKVLRVGVIEAPPYAYLSSDHQYTGLSIATWEAVAKAADLHYVYVPLDLSADRAVNLMAENKLDVTIGALILNRQRLEQMNFSLPYAITSIGVILPKESSLNAISELIKNFFLASVAYVSLAILFLFLLYINLLWYFERGKLKSIPLNYWEAMSKAIWVYLLKTSFGTPTTNYGRFIAFCWLILTVLVFSSFNATLTSIFSVLLHNSYNKIHVIDDLQNQKIAAPEQTYITKIASDVGVDIFPVHNLDEGYALLEQHNVNGLLYEYHTLNYFLSLQKNKDNYVVQNLSFVRYMYAFGVNKNDPQLLTRIDFALSKLETKREALKICERFIPDPKTSACVS